jgi:hypothetical protein
MAHSPIPISVTGIPLLPSTLWFKFLSVIFFSSLSNHPIINGFSARSAAYTLLYQSQNPIILSPKGLNLNLLLETTFTIVTDLRFLYDDFIVDKYLPGYGIKNG